MFNPISSRIFFSFAVFLEVILGIITCYLLDLYRCANRRSRPFLSVELCNVSRPARGHREVFLYFCDWQSAVDEKYTDEIQRIIHRFNHRETGLRGFLKHEQNPPPFAPRPSVLRSHTVRTKNIIKSKRVMQWAPAA